MKQENLDNLAAAISREIGIDYQAGQLFGLRWTLASVVNAGGGLREELNAPTKTALYELMSAYLAGIRKVKGHD